MQIISLPSRLLYFIEYLNQLNINDLIIPHLCYLGETLQNNKLLTNNIILFYGSAESGVWLVMNETIFGNKYFYYMLFD